MSLPLKLDHESLAHTRARLIHGNDQNMRFDDINVETGATLDVQSPLKIRVIS